MDIEMLSFLVAFIGVSMLFTGSMELLKNGKASIKKSFVMLVFGVICCTGAFFGLLSAV